MCKNRFEITELGRLLWIEVNFPKPKKTAFLLMNLHLGAVTEMYDLNQSNFVFILQKAYIHHNNSMYILPLHMHIHMYLQEEKDEVI